MTERPRPEGPNSVGGAAAWTAATLDPNWRRPLSTPEIDELVAGLDAFRRISPELDLRKLSAETFPIPALTAEASKARHQLVEGTGVLAFEGFPVDDFSLDELRAIWWAISSAIGTPVPQSHRGDVIGDVRDLGTGIDGKVGRGYTSNAELNFHADVADISGLFFLRTAREGGVSRISSSIATHDLIAERRPDLLAELYQPMPCSWQGNQPTGQQGWYDIPVFDRTGDLVSASYVRTNILLAHKNAGAPPLTDRQREAVAYVASVAAEPQMWVERHFEPGAMFFVHNHTVFHLRTAFVDHDEWDRKRHLLRVWLCPPNSRALPTSFATFFADVSPGGHRGGYESRSGEIVFATVPRA